MFEDYSLASISSISDLVTTKSITQLHSEVLATINSRDLQKFSLLVGVFEQDLIKAKRDPETYDEYLEWILEAAEEEEEEDGDATSIEFFKSLDFPIHPKYIIDHLGKIRNSHG